MQQGGAWAWHGSIAMNCKHFATWVRRLVLIFFFEQGMLALNMIRMIHTCRPGTCNHEEKSACMM